MLSKGDRVYTKGDYESGIVVEYMGDFDFPKVKVLFDGQTDPVVYYEDSLLVIPEPRDLESVLLLAENSESSDAILLAAEVRRLRWIETRVKAALDVKQEHVDDALLAARQSDITTVTFEHLKRAGRWKRECAELEGFLNG